MMYQKYTELSWNLSLNITGPVNLIICACNETNSFTEKEDSKSNSAPSYANLSLMLVVLNFKFKISTTI